MSLIRDVLDIAVLLSFLYCQICYYFLYYCINR